ncbi:MAG: DnaJ domain-containing protein [Verrucomicrobiota bacterium]|jgi:curved DNA-binding protein CbpA|nr:DnaJ domain-containing protein [Verrucomicrobiota bacterium]MDP6251697.1 DnaJ domain-containing protein [Verrucomicrobiota bacterium]MDP7178315.1 DnaJ domain-containing protein [Verrucomicrobiota bacterium]MDP7292593.1 DnaJ domain-containing protein [Verrucomicrobiota bacterium]HJN82863.1 DnaJ domain-containing protein [Verrucomicrobiota bacterium]
MTDYFALLGFPRRPWLDTGALKQRFHDLSAEVHPDLARDENDEAKAPFQRRFTEVNAAHQCLREARSRVRHLLELELGRAPGNVKSIPGEMTDWFMEIGSLCREVDAFLAKKAAQDSPLLQAALMGEGMELNDRVTEVHGRLQVELAGVDAELQSLGPAWEALDGETDGRAEKLPLAKLEALGQRLGFWSKWSSQLAERSSRLMF